MEFDEPICKDTTLLSETYFQHVLKNNEHLNKYHLKKENTKAVPYYG